MKQLDVKKIKPMKGMVLVEPMEAERKTASGIILSESNGEKPQAGKIIAMGEMSCDCGEDCKCSKEKNCGCKDLSVGEMVIYKKWGGNEVKIGEVEYQILKAEDILAKVA